MDDESSIGKRAIVVGGVGDPHLPAASPPIAGESRDWSVRHFFRGGGRLDTAGDHKGRPYDATALLE